MRLPAAPADLKELGRHVFGTPFDIKNA